LGTASHYPAEFYSLLWQDAQASTANLRLTISWRWGPWQLRKSSRNRPASAVSPARGPLDVMSTASIGCGRYSLKFTLCC